MSAVSEASLDTGGTPLEAIDATETTSFRLVLIDVTPKPSTKTMQWHKAQPINKKDTENFTMVKRKSDLHYCSLFQNVFGKNVVEVSLPHVEGYDEESYRPLLRNGTG